MRTTPTIDKYAWMALVATANYVFLALASKAVSMYAKPYVADDDKFKNAIRFVVLVSATVWLADFAKTATSSLPVPPYVSVPMSSAVSGNAITLFTGDLFKSFTPMLNLAL